MSNASNTRVVKNSLFLYFRMLFLMTVTLYTSRVVLEKLGVEDYGIYNVVGGVVAMFGFLNASMSSATQRYVTFALGMDDMKRLHTVFCTTLQIHIVIAGIIALLSETIGLWFLYNKMQIPADRIDAAFWVLQCSIFASVIMIISVPYNSEIIAHEKMSAFAYISILDAALRLGVVYLLIISSIDKLILYAFLILLVQLLVRFCYSFYCKHHFEETKYHHVWDAELFKEMTRFAGWSILGNFSYVVYTQGLNMLLNVFFGPAINAARGLAVQVQNAIKTFVGNFQMAINPQITKNYAKGKLGDMHILMFRSARFSFFLLFLLSLPVLFETKFILTIWLKNVPDNTVVFLRIMICTTLIYTFSDPLEIANLATGRVKRYQIVSGSILLFILPISYILLEIGCPAYSVFVVLFSMEALCMIARMILLRPLIGLRIRDYVQNIFFKVLLVAMFSVILPGILYVIMDDTFERFLAVSFLSLLSVSTFAYLIGLTSSERLYVKLKVLNLIKKKHGN